MVRSRHSCTILQMMGVEKTIARDTDEYVEIAVRLGADSAWREEVAGKIRMNKKNLLFITTIRQYMDWGVFLIDACGKP